MATVLVSLLILCILPLTCAWAGGYYRAKQLGSVDNKLPRSQSAELTGAGARAVAAQANCWEALALYSAALLAVEISGIELDSIANLAIAVSVLRILYVPLYIFDLDKLRSMAFIGSFGICMYLFYQAIGAA